MAKVKWTLDPAHSNIDFSIRHLMIAKVKGAFESFEADIEADPEDLTTADVTFTIDLSSVNTRSEDRDNHLRSEDFFEVEKYPNMTFQSKQFVRKGDGEYEVTGDLSLHGVTRSETFSLTFEGASKDPWGNEKVGFSGEGKINRSDYGLTWNAALETGGVMVGDEVKVTFEVQAAK